MDFIKNKIILWIIILAIGFVDIFLVWIIASTITSFLGVSGIVWWAFLIIMFFGINLIFGALNKFIFG